MVTTGMPVSEILARKATEGFFALRIGCAFLMRNAGKLQEARALRQGWRHYWNAKALDRASRAREAYVEAKRAFDVMPTTDRRMAFLEFGSSAVMLLHDLAMKAGIARGAEVELAEALRVFREMQKERSSRNRDLDTLVVALERALQEARGVAGRLEGRDDAGKRPH